VLFGGNTDGIVAITPYRSKSGKIVQVTGARLQTKSEFKKANPGMAKAERNRAYDAMRAEKGQLSKQAVARLMAVSDVIVTGAKSWDSGKFQISGCVLEEPSVKVSELEKARAELEAVRTQLNALQAERSAAPAVTVKATA
jgi:hypothetical protein